MPNRRIRTVWLSLAVAIPLLLAAACEQKKAEPPIPPPASAAEATPAAQPGNVRIEAGAAADADDDPRAPRVFPRSGQLHGWVKTAPVQLAEPDAQGFIRKPDSVSEVKINSLAHCEYKHPEASVRAVLIETASPEDALSLLTLSTDGRVSSPGPDGSLRVRTENGDSRSVYCWQGMRFLDLSGKWEDSKAVDQLADRILFPFEAADAPLLLRAMPPERLAESRLWVGRSARLLRSISDERLSRLDGSEIDRLLGLDGKATFTVASVPLQDGAAPAIIWLAKYPSEATASAAFIGYQDALQAKKADAQNTRVLTPVGTNLLGSWTAADKTVQDMLTALHAAITGPRPVPTSLPAPLPSKGGQSPATKPVSR